MPEYTEAFAHYILECKGAYEELCQRIESGEVLAGTKATVTIGIPANFVDEIRRERLALMANGGNGG